MNSRIRLFNNRWDGVFTTDFNLDHVRRRCYRLGKSLLSNNLDCLVAYDTRFMSNLFAQDVYHHLLLQGVPVSLVPIPVPLPAVQMMLEKQQAKSALFISARNRPYWYNGLVLLQPHGFNLSLAAHESDSTGEGELALQRFPATTESSAGADAASESVIDVRKIYLEAVRGLIDVNLIRRATLTIFANPMHGTMAGYLPAVIGDNSQTKAIEINREIDPLFGKITPMPTPAALVRLSKLVRESDSHIGLAFSADGTILGVVDKSGMQFEQFEVVLLLASYLATQYRQKGVVVTPPPAAGTPFANARADRSTWEDVLGFKVELTANATDRIIEFLYRDDENLLVGCTNEGELILRNYSPYPDALIAGLLLVELMARSGGSLRTSLDELRMLLAVPES